MTSREKRHLRLRTLQARLTHDSIYNDIAMVGQTVLILNGILFLLTIFFSSFSTHNIYALLLGILGASLAIILILFNVSKENYAKKTSKDRFALTHYLVEAHHLPHPTEESYLIASDWASLPLTLDRKKLLLGARIPITRALDPDTCAFTDEDLLIMEALHRGMTGSLGTP